MCLQMLNFKVRLFFLTVSPIMERFASVINCSHISRPNETNELLICLNTYRSGAGARTLKLGSRSCSWVGTSFIFAFLEKLY